MFGIGAIADAVGGVLDKFIPDAKDRLEAENLVMKQLHEINMGQISINKEEAKSSSLFVAGWRPFIGWACGSMFVYGIMGRDILNWILLLVNPDIAQLPDPNMAMSFELLMAMLGFGGLRTFEKLKGVQR